MNLDDLNASVFSEHQGERFCLKLGAEGAHPSTLDLELVEVSEGPCSARQESFSVLFAGPPEPLLPQQLYDLRHETLGALTLFLVPVGPGKDGRPRYEAVFNRLIG